jgi:signal transduction histidine kinase
VLLYVLAIVGPTLALLFLGLQSVQRQRQAVTSLTAANLRLSGERLVAEVERRVMQLAEGCLRDTETAGLRTSPGSPITLEEARALRVRLERIERRHPIADQLFVVERDGFGYPIAQMPGPSPIEDDPTLQESPSGRQFRTLFARAERQELLESRPREALENYRRCSELPVPDRHRAAALARSARCARKLDQSRLAEQAYERLTEQYGDVSDGSHRPFGLAAALELNDLKTASAPQREARLRSLYRDLIHGRWELSADQADYFLEELRERVPELPDPARGTGYLRRLELARGLQERFRAHASLRGGELQSSAFTYLERPYQLLYTLEAPDTLLGLAVNLPFVETRLLPEASTGSGLDIGHIARVTPRGSREPGGLALIPFQTLFPFWEVTLAPAVGGPARAFPRRDIAIFVGSTVLVLCVLALGVLLLLRDVARETQLSRLRSDFVSGVSHELKTPLTLIRLYTETLLDGGYREPERKGFYQIILRESERLTHLIERALEFGRVDRRERRYELGRADLAPFIAQTVQVYGEFLKRRGFTVETSLPCSSPAVDFDPDAVAQAVVNLLDNASKYSGDSKFVGVRLESRDSTVVLEVEDRGIGIPPDEREKIFQQFYRSRTRTGKGGYGLGLFLVKHIMDAHGGRVEVESEAGLGSRFRLVFPASASRSDAASAEPR